MTEKVLSICSHCGTTYEVNNEYDEKLCPRCYHDLVETDGVSTLQWDYDVVDLWLS